MDAGQAAEALAAAIQQDNVENGTESTNERIAREAQQEVAGEQATQPVGSEGTTHEDSFTGIDPNSLEDPRLVAQYRSMQADYTRKMQDISERAKRYDALDEVGGVDAAMDALEFASNLATNPQFALSVHESLTQALTEAGLTPAQASAEASRQIDEAVREGTDEDFGFGDETRLPPEIEQKLQRLDSLEQRIAEVDTWRQQQEEREYQLSLANEISTQENEIVRANPDYTEDDINYIYGLAYSTGGNLLKANQLYQELQSNLLSRYLERKSSVTAPPHIAATGAADQPRKFTDLNDPELERLVQQRIAKEQALGNL